MRGARRAAALLVVVAALVLAGCGAAPATRQVARQVVRVAAASDLKFALDEIATSFRRSHPAIDVRITYGSSGTFLQQISNGAPYDLYLSADLAYPQRLVAAGLASADDVFSYAVGRLVVWTPAGSAVDPAPGLRILARPEVSKVSIANPEHAPYGKAAVAALQSAGVYEQVAGKLILGENVAQAADFVQSGGADAGIVAMSLVLSDPLRGKGRWVEVPLSDYPRLEQGGVVLGRASSPGAAREFRAAMLDAAGRQVLKKYGLFLPSEP